eukprot:GHVR01178730.1.p1 GENE.GHVR01178730.1~~GHVR01178730.1.p1  ORF type:complete len:111 (-),score=6.17 GHVR01178730.1:74-406(-)
MQAYVQSSLWDYSTNTTITVCLPVLAVNSPSKDVGQTAEEIKPGDVRVIVKALYSLMTAPSLFGKTFAAVQTNLVYEPIDRSVLIKTDHSTQIVTIVMWKHVDDCQVNIE